MPVTSQKLMPSPSLLRRRPWLSLEGGEPGCFHCIDCMGRRIVLMDQHLCRQFSGSFRLNCFSRLLQQVGIIFPVNMSAVLRLSMKEYPLHPKKLMPSLFLLRKRPLPSFEGVSQGASTASIVLWSLAQSGGPNTHPE